MKNYGFRSAAVKGHSRWPSSPGGAKRLAAFLLALGALLPAAAEETEAGRGAAGEASAADPGPSGGEEISLRSPSSASEAEVLLRKGDDAYLDTRYEEAASFYQAVAEAGFGSADVWFNLGNARWQAGRAGEAVVAWERALLRDPRHRDALANLSLARESLVDELIDVEPAPAIERLARRLSIRGVVWGLALAWVATVVVFVSRRRSSRRRLLGAAAALGVLLVVVFGSLSAVAIWYHEGVVRAVVTVSVAQVRSGPAPRFDSSFEVHEGLVVRVTDYEGPYARVRLGNERSGWVLRRNIETI